MAHGSPGRPNPPKADVRCPQTKQVGAGDDTPGAMGLLAGSHACNSMRMSFMDSGPTITTQNESTTPESPGKDNKIQRRYNMRQPYWMKPGDGHQMSWRGRDKPRTDLDRSNRLPFRPEKDAEPGARPSAIVRQGLRSHGRRSCPVRSRRAPSGGTRSSSIGRLGIDDGRAMAAPFKEKWVMTMSPR
jgi:hypothetical protein